MKNIGSMASQNFQNFEKDENFNEIFIFYENFKISRNCGEPRERMKKEGALYESTVRKLG